MCVCRCGLAFCSRTGVEFECGADLFSEWDSLPLVLDAIRQCCFFFLPFPPGLLCVCFFSKQLQLMIEAEDSLDKREEE